MLAIYPSLLICASVVASSQHTANMKLKFIPVIPITTPKPVNKLPIVLEVHENNGFAHAPGKDSVSNMRYTALTQEDTELLTHNEKTIDTTIVRICGGFSRLFGSSH